MEAAAKRTKRSGEPTPRVKVVLDFPFIWLAVTESMSTHSFTKNNTQLSFDGLKYSRVCVCVCVCEREREGERERSKTLFFPL